MLPQTIPVGSLVVAVRALKRLVPRVLPMVQLQHLLPRRLVPANITNKRLELIMNELDVLLQALRIGEKPVAELALLLRRRRGGLVGRHMRDLVRPQLIHLLESLPAGGAHERLLLAMDGHVVDHAH